MDELSGAEYPVTADRKPDYGNWIRMRIIVLLCLISLLLLGCGFIPWHVVFRITMFCLAGIAFFTTFIVVYAYRAFSPKGGDYQRRIYDLVIGNLGWRGEGTCLDIGAGNGGLIITIAKKYPGAICTGLDYWGKDWAYSRQVCEENAAIEGVSDRVSFSNGSASALPFGNGHFDAVVSNLTFHEVKDTADTVSVVREALRVLKPGGRFSFLDLFFDVKHYGQNDVLEGDLDSLGLAGYTLKKVDEVMSLPLMLKHKKVLGLAGVLYGEK